MSRDHFFHEGPVINGFIKNAGWALLILADIVTLIMPYCLFLTSWQWFYPFSQTILSQAAFKYSYFNFCRHIIIYYCHALHQRTIFSTTST
jgi:hypothetical protein